MEEVGAEQIWHCAWRKRCWSRKDEGLWFKVNRGDKTDGEVERAKLTWCLGKELIFNNEN